MTVVSMFSEAQANAMFEEDKLLAALPRFVNRVELLLAEVKRLQTENEDLKAKFERVKQHLETI